MTIHLCHEGRQLGAFSKEQVEEMLKAGVITDGTLAWASAAEWKTFREFLGAAMPPPVPPPQTAVAPAFGLTAGCPSPIDDTPKGGLPSPPSAPPTIATPAFEACLSESVRQEILKLAKVPFGQIIAWTLFILGIGVNGVNVGTRSGPNPVASGLMFVCGIFVLRSWCSVHYAAYPRTRRPSAHILAGALEFWMEEYLYGYGCRFSVGTRRRFASRTSDRLGDCSCIVDPPVVIRSRCSILVSHEG